MTHSSDEAKAMDVEKAVERKTVWHQADTPRGLILRLPGVSLMFNHNGNLVGFSNDPEGSRPVYPMRLARREDVGREMHLIFEPTTDDKLCQAEIVITPEEARRRLSQCPANVNLEGAL